MLATLPSSAYLFVQNTQPAEKQKKSRLRAFIASTLPANILLKPELPHSQQTSRSGSASPNSNARSETDLKREYVLRSVDDTLLADYVQVSVALCAKVSSVWGVCSTTLVSRHGPWELLQNTA